MLYTQLYSGGAWLYVGVVRLYVGGAWLYAGGAWFWLYAGGVRLYDAKMLVATMIYLQCPSAVYAPPIWVGSNL